MSLTFSEEENPDIETMNAIEDGLVAYNTPIAGPHNRRPLWLVGRDETGKIQAGLKAVSYFQWLFIDWLWIAEPLRKQNYGSHLLAQAEDIARTRGCVGVYLDTFTFQAPHFYPRHGYTECGRIKDFPPGFDRIYYSKKL